MADNNRNNRCPNCGAEADAGTRYCPFCGTLLADEQQPDFGREAEAVSFGNIPDNTNTVSGTYVYTTEAERTEQNDFVDRAAAEVTDTRKVDIVAQPASEAKGDMGSSVFALVVWVVFGGFILRVASGAGFFRIIILLIFISGIVSRIKKIQNASKPAMERLGHDYKAVVLDHSISTDTLLEGDSRRIITVGKVKVLANIAGQETCILISAGDGHVTAMYPVGCTVTIRGYSNYWMIKE